MSKLFTPGPTNVPDFIRETYQEDCFHHRKDEFHDMFRQIIKKLKKVFKAKAEVLVLTASGTGAMEASVLNFFNKGDKVLVINTGVFGQRFVELCHLHELDVTEYKVENGKTFVYEDVKELILNQTFNGVFMTYSETSTGILNDVKQIGELTKTKDTLLVVDAISGLVVNDLNVDEWGIDVCLAGSQKGFLLPPGLSFVALSKRAVDKLHDMDVKSMYLNLKLYIDFLRVKAETPFTPAVFELRALNKALDYLLGKGLDDIQKEKEALKNVLIEGFSEIGFIPFAEHTKNNTLVAFTRNESFDFKSYITYMQSKGYVIAGGQRGMLNKIIRVGLIGEVDQHDIEGLIQVTKIYFKEIGHG
jgi:aspartate aminotransferase-like enzyme